MPGRRIGIAEGLIAAAGLVWLAATLVTAHASVVGNADNPDVSLAAAAFALPNLVAAALLAGAASALVAVGALRASATVRRLVVGLAAGTGLGAVCAGLIVFGYGGQSRVVALAVTVGVAAVLGGASAALPRPVHAASLLAMLGVLAVGLIGGFAQPGLIGLLGGDGTLDSEVSAGWFAAYLVGIAGGGVSGVLGFWLLRRYGPRAWPWYVLAGAAPGFVLLATELLTRTGGAALLGLVRGLSEGDRYAVEFSAFARLRNAMLVLFVGGLASMIAVGRTLRPAPAAPEEAPAGEDLEHVAVGDNAAED